MNNSVQKKNKCRIIVDAMGGDFAPQNAVEGSILAAEANSNIDLYLVGQRDKIQSVLIEKNLRFEQTKIISASQIIEMGDAAAASLKSKPDSSIVVGCQYVKDKKADAFVSAGNTGAMMTASTLIMGRISGVGRPTIGAMFPSTKGFCYLYDVGAGKDAKPQHLYEYAVMGVIYAKEMHGIINPSVGLLSMGEEESKGNELTLAAYKLLKDSGLNFIGNVEGRDILNGNADVIVCDGFVGNIILKFGESVPKLLKHLLQETSKSNLIDKLKIGVVKGVLRKALKPMDYQEHGGVPLLGVNGISIIGHGSSSAIAIRNMVFKAYEMFEHNLVGKIEKSLKINNR